MGDVAVVLVYSVSMRILGIDPGTGRTGWAVIEKKGGRETLIDCGCLETTVNSPLPERLENIFAFFQELVEKFKPDQAAVEDLFFFSNAKTVISVAQARGVVLLALRLAKIPTANYSPLQVKSAVTGYGTADKKMVQKMVLVILKTKEIPKLDDTADAMAVALTHSAVIRSN